MRNNSEKSNKTKMSVLLTLKLDIDQLIYCLGEEMSICSDSVRNTMKPRYNELSNKRRELKHLLSQYPNN